MKNALTIVGSILVCCVLYLLFWPVPVDPVAWDAPVDQGLVAPYGPNDRLRRAQGIDLGDYQGPEDVTSGIDGQLYATTSGGAVIRINSDGDVSLFADVGGRALGIETDTDGSLVVANAYLGVQRISPQGTVSTLLNEVEGKALLYADDLAIADDGVIYFSDASSKFGAQQSGGTFEASLLDIMEHGGHGRVIRFDPASGEARVIIDNLNFANGVAISDDQDFLLISETGSYRILKHWLQGPAAGSNEVLLDNLPGFPDNINNGRNGRFWIGFVAPRSGQLDAMADKPFMRKVVQRLPASFRPKAEPLSHVIAINGDGRVLMNLRDPQARFPALTGVFETRDALYLTALFGNQLARLDKDDL